MSNSHTHDCHNADEQITENVNTVGWSVVMIEATDYLPSFAYTIGLWKSYQHPEIIAFGLTVKTLHIILNIAGENVKKGMQYGTDKVYSDFFTNGVAQLISVDRRNIRDYFGYAIWFNGGLNFPALEVVWADRNNKFPWEVGYEEEFQYKQPLLDRNAEFKFREAHNLGIFTTRQWLEEKKPILRVVHDDDGDWQFLTGDQMPDDIRLVCLGEMVKADSTLNDVFNLDYGEAAERSAVGEVWNRQEVCYDE
jgi:hypothetical protein